MSDFGGFRELFIVYSELECSADVFELAVYRGIRSRLVSPLPNVRIDVPISKILRPNRPKEREQVEFHA